MKRLVPIALALLLLVVYQPLAGSVFKRLESRPAAVKMGLMPRAGLVKTVLPDYRLLLAQVSVARVLFYFGTLFELNREALLIRPEYHRMYQNLTTAVKLDPYNLDAYYFLQAIFTWDVGRVREVNRILDYGMSWRTWDYMLPFYAGFNSAYFLQDYQRAAAYMQKATDLSGRPLFARLTARFMHETGRDDLAIAYLESMEKGAKDPAIRQEFADKLAVFRGIKTISEAVAAYRTREGRLPVSLTELQQSGILAAIPEDPYGGTFHVDADGRVQATSLAKIGRMR